MRMLLAISTLKSGGAERVMATLADAFARRGHHVTLLTLDASSADSLQVASGVERIGLGRYEAARSWMAWLSNVIRIIEIGAVVDRVRPEVVISFIAEMNVLTIIACARRRVPVLVSERVDPRFHRMSRLWDWLRWHTYPYASGLVVQTSAVAEWLTASKPRMPTVTVIPNPVRPLTHRPERAPPSARAYLLAAGRLTYQKGFDVLINAFSLLVRQGVDLDLVIAGEGGERSALLRLAAQLGVAERVRLVGHTPDLEGWMTAAFAFVLSSRYEGFPNVLLEALACGTAAIATDCPSGPREILDSGAAGLLVPCEDPAAIAHAVMTLHTDPDLRARLRRLGPGLVGRFSIDAVVSRWESLMRRAVCP